ncbi:hypothetical protein VVS222_03896 [Vibrio vulnificus]|nr:hypothetical protein VVS222_03896 [Vibrio vulnificus]
MASPRYLVGIDLGTTNTVVAFCELTENLQQSNVSLFDIDQLIGPGEVVRKPLLPSSATTLPTGKSPLLISPCRGKTKLWLATLLM